MWIEIKGERVYFTRFPVTPYAGVWIEIPWNMALKAQAEVTPYAGVWIEILRENRSGTTRPGHSLRGSVD